jgi:hypothetical protein
MTMCLDARVLAYTHTQAQVTQYNNFKITTPAELKLLKRIFRKDPRKTAERRTVQSQLSKNYHNYEKIIEDYIFFSFH